MYDANLAKIYSDKRYVSTTMVRHSGTTVAFAMDDQRRIYYSVLDLNQISNERGPLDAQYWNEEPVLLSFPNELVDVGLPEVGAPGPVSVAARMPSVKKGSRSEAEVGRPLSAEEKDPFLSTTARLSAQAPIQVVSDGRYILVFRQSVDRSDEDVVFQSEGGGLSGDWEHAKPGASAVVDSSLLCDRFVLVGSVLKPVVEVRYQRSRSKHRGTSEQDTMGTRDMEGEQFFEPTVKLSFVALLKGGGFAVLLLPTAVEGAARWQIFATNDATGRLESFNCAQGADGLFDVAGVQLYTSPDPKFAGAVLERAPGVDPNTKLALVPVPAATDRAGTALRFDPAKNTHAVLGAAPANKAPVAYCVEAWIKPSAGSGTILAHHTGSSPTSWFCLQLDAGRHLVADHNGARTTGGTALPVGGYAHVAAVFDGSKVTLYVNGAKDGERAATAVPDPRSAASVGAKLAAGAAAEGFSGDIDEVRLWERARAAGEFGDRGRRLTGIETGLVGYYRFDEGSGTVLGDHTRELRDGELKNSPAWVASGAPAGDGPGLSRDTFVFTDRTVATGLAASLYYQQEPAATGYGTEVVQEKRQSRLLLACATSGPAPDGGVKDRAYVTTLDFALGMDGRPAMAPARIVPAAIGRADEVGDTAKIEAAEAVVQTARDALAADRALVERSARTRALIDEVDAELILNEGTRAYGMISKSVIDVRETTLIGQRNRLAADLAQEQAAALGLGAREAQLTAAEDALATVSGGTRGGGDTVLAMPLVGADRQGLSVFAALLTFAWTTDAPFILDSSTGDVVLYFRGGDGQFFSAYYSTLVSRAVRTLDVGTGKVEFVARDAAAKLSAFTVTVADAAVAERCTVTLTYGKVTETFALVPRAAASFAAVLNGLLPPEVMLGTVLSVTGQRVELAYPLAEAVFDGSLVSVGEQVRTIAAAAAAGATALTMSGGALSATAGSAVSAVLYDYANATSSTPGVSLAAGSQIVSVNRVNTTEEVPNGTASPVAEPLGPHWRGHAPGRAPSFDGREQYLSAAAGAAFAAPGDLTVEAWVNPTAVTGQSTVVHAAIPGAPYSLALQKSQVFSALTFNDGMTLDCGDTLSLAGTDFTIELWVKRHSKGHIDALFGHGATQQAEPNLVVGFRGDDKFSFGVSDDEAVSDSAYPDADWHHWAVVYDNTTRVRTLYRDGVKISCAGATARDAYTGVGRTMLGCTSYRMLHAYANMDEIRVWGQARTAEQIKASMNLRLRGREANLLAYWSFADESVADRSGNGHDGALSGGRAVTESGLRGYALQGTVGTQTVKSKQGFPAGQWGHVAMAFEQHWAMSMDGFGHLDAGGPGGLDLTGDLTIEAGIRLDSHGSLQGLVSKGTIQGGPAGSAVPYAFYVEADGQLAFTFEAGGGGQDNVKTYRSGLTLRTGVFGRVAVTRKAKQSVDGGSEICFYIDGTLTNVFSFDGAKPVGNDANCELGMYRLGATAHGLRGTLAEMRIWNVARPHNQIGAAITAKESGLVAWWTFPENQGPITADACDAFPAKLRGARRVRTPDPQGNRFTFYHDGVAIPAWPVTAAAADPGGQSAPVADLVSLAGRPAKDATVTSAFAGTLDEVRIWGTCRTHEQILDNLFNRLRGEREDLIAHYPFDGASTEPGALVHDTALRGNDLTPSAKPPANVLSTAPISHDSCEVRSALTGITSSFNTLIGATPAVAEYGDLQSDVDGQMIGVMKRAYACVRSGSWVLNSGFKIGDLTTTWVGQAQFDPQLIGFLEGAPPMPSENMIHGTGDYAEKASVSFVQADEVTNSMSSDNKKSAEASAKITWEVSVTGNVFTIAAPLGVGTAIPVKVKAGRAGEINFKFAHGWSDNLQVSQGTNITRTSGVVLTGQWEAETDTGQVNPTAGRRWVPANTGFAIVQSATADQYALRIADSGVLVAYRMVPNADIPRDWNIIAFPINPQYTKQGTLDGLLGFAAKGTAQTLQPFADPAFPHAGDGGEYSYYRPREAYALKRRIQREEQQLQAFYESVSIETHTPDPVREQADRVLNGMMGGTGGTGLNGGGSDPAAARTAAKAASRRHMANTYVWTAAGGLFSETTSTTEQVTQVTAGDYSVSGSATYGGLVEIEAGPVGIKAAGSATLGGGYTVTRAKTKDATRTFSLEVVAQPGRDLQKYDKDGKAVFDIDDKPVLVPGRVDAYRFMSFYLDSSTDNYEDFYGKVIDPEWLDRNNSADAAALRQTRQSDRKPPCWRILHRVTFVSRVLDTSTSVPSLAKAMGSLGIASDYELIHKLHPHLTGATGSFAALAAAAKTVLATQFAALVPYTDTITARLADYYHLPPGLAGLTASSAPAPAPAPATPTSKLTTSTPSVAKGTSFTFQYSTPPETVSAKNWIGLYPAGKMPPAQVALDWEYAPNASGSVAVKTVKVPGPGTYTALYFHNDGYTVLADPITLTVT